MTEDQLKKKREIFEARKGTTHWPVFSELHHWSNVSFLANFSPQNMNIVPAEIANNPRAIPRRPDGSPDVANRDRPFHEPRITPAVLRLVGIGA